MVTDMDANNIAFYVTHKRHGYPAGGFFTRVLDMIFEPPAKPDDRLRALTDMFNRADDIRTAQLNAVLPRVRPIIQALYEDEALRPEVLELLEPTLRVLPQLLVRMSDIINALDDYTGRREPA